MGPFDTIALLFCAVIAGFKVVGELQDLRLCNLAISRIPNAALSKGWRVALALLGGLRRWVFLPCMVTDVALVVAARGADALNISLNTVAILFICELDDILYQLGLPERFKTRVVTEGRVTLNDQEATALFNLKAHHVVVVVVSVHTIVSLLGTGLISTEWLLFPNPLFLAAGCVEVATDAVAGGTWKGAPLRALKVLGAFTLGWFGTMISQALSGI
jgi:hypothetical protein